MKGSRAGARYMQSDGSKNLLPICDGVPSGVRFSDRRTPISRPLSTGSCTVVATNGARRHPPEGVVDSWEDATPNGVQFLAHAEHFRAGQHGAHQPCGLGLVNTKEVQQHQRKADEHQIDLLKATQLSDYLDGLGPPARRAASI